MDTRLPSQIGLKTPNLVVRREAVGNFLLLLVLLCSATTYMIPDGKFAFYLATLLCLVAASFFWRLVFRGNEIVVGAILVFAVSLYFSLLLNSENLSRFPLQPFVYPVTATLLVGMGWRFFAYTGRRTSKVILLFFSVNAVVALLASLHGGLYIPVFGEVVTGRKIFLTNMPSSAGLLWNVNYFAATQVVGFWYCFFLHKQGMFSRKESWLLYLVAISVICGSSRSCTLGFLGSIVLYVFFTSGFYFRVVIFSILVFLSASAYSIYQYVLSNEALYLGLRVYKGLNSRDELWAISVELFARSPFLGYGDASYLGELLQEGGAHNPTVQNTYLNYALTAGVFGFLSLVFIYLATFSRFLVLKEKSAANVAAFSLFFFVSIDSFVRTYSFGGVGVVPLLGFSSISYLGVVSASRKVR